MSRPTAARVESTTAFPDFEEDIAPDADASPPRSSSTRTREGSLFRPRTREQSVSNSRARKFSLRFQESAPPLGFLQATGEVAAHAPTFGDIRRGTYSSRETQSQWRRSSISSSDRSRASSGATIPNPPVRMAPSRGISAADVVPEHADEHILASIPSGHALKDKDAEKPELSQKATKDLAAEDVVKPETDVMANRVSSDAPSNSLDAEFPTGYHFPPKHTRWQSTVIGAKAFWKFTITPFGFLIVIYGCNIVAWGGMLFLLLIGGGKAMCHPTCNDINSARRIWIEIDSQILNALFCVTGLGLIPWRFRDLYYLMQYRLRKNYDGLRRLAGINRGWFRLEGSDTLPVPALAHDADIPISSPESALALPETSNPDPPLTGFRAPPTKVWKLDLVIWLYVWNTFLQIVLCGFMWGLNRIDRPSWSTGTFVALACIVAAAGGIIAAIEANHVKKVEGVPWGEADLILDAEQGVGTKADHAVLGVKDKEAEKIKKVDSEKKVKKFLDFLL
ncbi:MAG: hypothetical protein M1814_003310 [Vezdaea aestivalis]|nr:MAG: hypothetical protein M1814_003310 [Vezdaea aestivalis]